MTPAELAALHARCFTSPPPWGERDFESLLADAGVCLLSGTGGFIMIRLAADECEILTLAVDPDARRLRLGTGLVERALALATETGAATAFLEVSVSNTAAIGLYTAAGFTEAGRRRAYYRMPDGSRVDALILRRDLDVR